MTVFLSHMAFHVNALYISTYDTIEIYFITYVICTLFRVPRQPFSRDTRHFIKKSKENSPNKILSRFYSDQAPRTTVIDTAAIQAPPGKGCPRCGGVVYAAEQVLAKGREWHRKCFKCRDCTKTLDSIIACDGPDGEVYCKTCYGKKWGPHGYGFACGSGFLQTDGLS